MKVLGASGNVSRADLQGQLVIVVEDDDGNMHNIDLGITYGMEQVPVNLLSASLLLHCSFGRKDDPKIVSVALMACLKLVLFLST